MKWKGCITSLRTIDCNRQFPNISVKGGLLFHAVFVMVFKSPSVNSQTGTSAVVSDCHMTDWFSFLSFLHMIRVFKKLV